MTRKIMASASVDSGRGDTLRTLPILPSAISHVAAPHDDAMDTSPPGPPHLATPRGQNLNETRMPHRGAQNASSTPSNTGGSNGNVQQQPKVVQTAFIHKLYSMLEDPSIEHLISWSASNESFLISPSGEFSKVLASYFKHTNVSSFVRQLNMYGFHKVSDVFHTGTPDAPLWEFKHGNGNFRRGDLNGLREIKRRASRHTLINRESFSNAPKSTSQPQPPSSVEHSPDSTEGRLAGLENSLFEVHGRLARAEESNAAMAARCQELSEKLARSYQHNHEISSALGQIVEDPNHPVRRSISHMQEDIRRHLQTFNIQPEEPERTPPRAPLLTANFSPLSRPFDEGRRASIQALPPSQGTFARPTRPRSPRRLGSMGTGAATANSSPLSRNVNLAPPPTLPNKLPPISQSLQQGSSPLSTHSFHNLNLSRRHTSGDIRSPWESSNEQAPPLPSYDFKTDDFGASGVSFNNPFATTENKPGYHSDSQLQSPPSRYSIQSGPASRNSPPSGPETQAISPGQKPIGSSIHLAPPPETNWSLPPAVRVNFNNNVFGGNKGASGLASQGSSGPSTRRSSMANIYSVLNPAETAEKDEDDSGSPTAGEGGEDGRKRKRLG